jgi:hypothetical protein
VQKNAPAPSNAGVVACDLKGCARGVANFPGLRLSRASPFLLVLFGLVASSVLATSPNLVSILPVGAQRGTEVELSFDGDRLQDAEEVLCYEPGLQVLKLNSVTNKQVKAQLKLASDCPLGEHHLRIRTATGLSEIRTFFVGAFPEIQETEPNNEPAKAQKIALNTTVAGVIKNEDVDCFAVDLKQGQRLSAEVEGMRLGRGAFDPRLVLLGPDGAQLSETTDTWLGMQDPFTSLVAPKDGTYVVRLCEATYGGNDNCHYRIHIGSFARPTAVLPPGGHTGETVSFNCFGQGTNEFVYRAKLPDLAEEKFGLFPELDGVAAPTPNWIRVSDFPNVLAVPPNESREHATATTNQAPFAFNGVIAEKNQENWFSFPATKGVALTASVYARRLRSPLDSVLEVLDPQGKSIASDDDAAGADSSLKFTPAETTNHFVRVRDTFGRGGRDFVYRIEVAPVEPALTVKIPEVARNDTQSRQYIAVPRGNRFATLISAKRANFGAELVFDVNDMPTGVTLHGDRMAANIDAMPLVFEAAADAPVAGRLLDLTATATNGTNAVVGRFRQEIELVQGPNNTTFYSSRVEKFCIAVTKEAPYQIQIVEPKVPLVQAGSMRLEVVAIRAAGFDEPITLNMVWNPPGVSSESEITIAKGATNGFYQLNANGGAETRKWKIALLAHATVDGAPLYVSSQLAEMEVAKPFLTGKIETLWTNPGKPGKLTVNLQQAKAFEGKATIRLCGLPENVTAADKEITKDDQEVTFDVTVDPNCGNGSHKNLFCAVDVKQDGQVIPHTIARGGILRIVPQKKTEQKVAAADKK